MANDRNVLAIDVGSSRVKLGWFPAGGACTSDKPAANLLIAAPPLPTPLETFHVEHRDRPAEAWTAEVDARLSDLPPSEETVCVVASVHRGVAELLLTRLRLRQWAQLASLHAADLALQVRVTEPEKVGLDRLLGALAINRLRRSEAAAIAVDMGTATTVDLIANDGAFEGGAIIAGPTLALTALHAGTASLPRLDESVLAEPPTAVGKSTAEAMAAGAYWGTVGAVRELIRQIAEECATQPQVFLTGGGAAGFAPLIGCAEEPARHLPGLVLSGIRLAADGLSER